MRYRLTCLTPLLVGDGRKLSPIDYMVWKDHVNVLDQWRIFRLLAKGPRLEGYLTQLKNAEKLDFASWGGFAQNFAGRRIPFENAAYSAYWNRAVGDSLHIPTFAAGASGPYLPATAIKGALRTGMVFANWRDGMLQDVLARVKGERLPRRPAEIVEEQALGPAGTNRMRFVGAGDSAPVATTQFKIYLLRTSTLQPRGGISRWAGSRARAARWMARAPRTARRRSPKWPCRAPPSKAIGTRRPSSCSPKCGARMRWPESLQPRQDLRSRSMSTPRACWRCSASTPPGPGMGLLDKSLDELEQRLAAAREKGACLLSLGWGGGLPAKSAWLDTTNADYRQILEQYQIYNRALATNLPFPKTRRIVFLNNRPATLPGWAELEVV